MRKKKQKGVNPEEDRSIFLEAMKDVRRLETTNKVVHSVRRKRRQPIPEDSGEFDVALPMPEMEESVGLEDSLFFHRGGLQQTLLRKLKRGQIAAEEVIDLHGMRKSDAGRMLQAFILHCQQQGLRCVRVIHGKGYRSEQGTGVLKGAVKFWLQEHKAVLAFASTPSTQGGTGAVNILLKKIIES
ncbi:MAG: Smr/MutS family protein [Gammaproteobacteria bacterium]|nr:Smr/MutS family protein [Gammaproteobacteria bacterium]